MKKLLGIVSLHILLLSLIQFIPWPENLLWPYFHLHGFAYYQDIFVLYPPLYWLSLGSFYNFFGLSIRSLTIYTYLVFAATDFLLYFAANKKLLSVIIYLPLQIFFEGNGLWVDHLLAPLFLASFLAFKKKKFLLLGLLLGASLLTKQTAIYFIAILVLSVKNIKTYLGLFIAIFLLFLYLLLSNSLSGFYDSAVKYILTFHAQYPLQTQWPTFRQLFISSLIFIPAIYIGMTKKHFLLTGLTIAATLGIFTRFEYFHLQPALPLATLLLAESSISIPFVFIFLIFFAKFFLSVYHLPMRFFEPAILANTKIIRSYIPKNSTVRFLNTWDHYYFLTNTLPANRYFVPNAPWTLDYDRIQEKLMNPRPETLIYNPCFRIKNICYEPKKIAKIIKEEYLKRGELTDGTGIFEYNPVSVSQKIQANNRH